MGWIFFDGRATYYPGLTLKHLRDQPKESQWEKGNLISTADGRGGAGSGDILAFLNSGIESEGLFAGTIRPFNRPNMISNTIRHWLYAFWDEKKMPGRTIVITNKTAAAVSAQLLNVLGAVPVPGGFLPGGR